MLKNLLSLFIAITLTACSGSNDNATIPTSNTVTLSGLAAEGNPLVDTLVEIRGSNGQSTSTRTNASGQFSANVSNLDYPIMVKSVGANSYFSAVYNGGYVNVTPFTTLALASLLGTHPENIYSNFTASILKTPAELNLASVSVVQKMQALVALQNIDFFNDQFSAQAGDAYDDLLEALRADLTAQGKTLVQLANEIIVENNPSPSCPNGQHLENNVCTNSIRSCSVNNGVGEQVHVNNYWEACQVVSCNTNYTQVESLCLPSSRECTTLPHNAIAGSETWNGSTWGACQIRECSSGYELDNNECAIETTPIEASLGITSTTMDHSQLDLRSVNLGTKTLYLSYENNLQDGYFVDSTNQIKTFIDPIPTNPGYFSTGALMGNTFYYQLSATQQTGKMSLFHVDSSIGGVSQEILLDSTVAGYTNSARAEMTTRGSNIYYRAQQGSGPLTGTGLYKYSTVTQTSSKVISDISTYSLMLKEKLASENIVYFHRATDVTPAKYILTALDSNDQVLTLNETLMSEYECLSGSLSVFNECTPIFLEGRALIQFRSKVGDNYKMLVTDGTIAGTSLIDIPYHLGSLLNVAFLPNKMLFTALRKDNLTAGQQVYGYSHSEGFHLVANINSGDFFNSVTVLGITASGNDAYIVAKRTVATPPTYAIAYSGEIIKTNGSPQTTTTIIPSVTPEFLSLMNANAYDRGPFIALKGHLVFSSSNRSTDSNSLVQLKAINLSDQSIVTIKSSFVGNAMYYKKDPNSEKIIVSEKSDVNVNNYARLLILE